MYSKIWYSFHQDNYFEFYIPLEAFLLPYVCQLFASQSSTSQQIVNIKLLGLFSWTLEEEWIFLFCKLLSVFNKFTRIEAIGSRSEGYGSSALIVVSFVVISAILGELSFNLGVIKFA